MSDDPGRVHEERSQRSADQLRAMLTALATAGIAATWAVRDRTHGDYWRGAAFFFTGALASLLISWFLVKHRAVKRRDYVRDPTIPNPDPFRWYLRSWTWDRVAAIFIAAGIFMIAIGFDQ